MKKIAVSELIPNAEYEKRRAEFRSRVITLKKHRAINLGPLVRLVFENRETVLFQIQEMLFVERQTDESKREEEVRVYNDMVPGNGELKATLMIEITEEDRIRETLEHLKGLDRGPYIHIVFGNDRVTAQFEPDRSTEEKLSSVHYVTFGFSPEVRRHFLERKPTDRVMLLSDHPRYSAMAPLSGEMIESLKQDLRDDP